MKRKNKPKIAGVGRLCAALAAVLLIALLFMTDVMDKQKTWTDVKLDYRDEKTSFVAADGYGPVSSGPYYDLPAGEYRLKWQMEGDGENIIRLTCSNDVEITPSEIRTTPGKWQDEAEFEIKGPAHNVSIGVEFLSGESLKIYNFRLYSPMYKDHAFTAVLALLGALMVMIWMNRANDRRQCMEALVILGMAVVFASLPFLREDSIMAWDVQYHTLRIMNLADGLKGGQFPVRAGGFSYNGYGAVTSAFYPDLFLYPLAWMMMGGASLSYVVNVAAIAVNALSAVTMYTAAKRMLRDHRAALCAAVLFVLSTFRIWIAYDSFMLGWLLGMAFMPLFFAELWEVVTGDKRRWVCLALTATLIFQAHLLSVVLCALAAVGVCIVFLPKLVRGKRIMPLLKAIALALALNAFMIVPMVMYYWGGVNTPVVQFGFANAALEVHELFKLEGKVGLALLLGVAALLTAGKTENEDAYVRYTALSLLGGGALCMLLSSELIPWSHIVKLTAGAVEILQFPWRVLALTAVFFSLCGGYGYVRLFGGKGAQTVLWVLALSIICMSPWTDYAFEEKGILEFGRGANAYIVTPEYQIEGTDVNDTRSRAVMMDGDAQLTAYEKDGTRITAQVETSSGASLSFPLFGFDGYAAELNGERIAWRLGHNNRLTVDLPAGASGEIRIWFEGKAIWRVTDAVSAVTALSLLVIFLKKKRSLH